MTTPHRRRGCVDAYRTKHGLRYRAIWDEPREPESAQVRRRQVSKGGFVRARDAEAYLGRVLVAIEDGNYVSPRPITFKQFAGEWLDGFRGAATTRDGYTRNLRLHVYPALGPMRLSRIRAGDLAALYRRLADGTAPTDAADGYSRAPLGPNTILKIHTLIGTILQAAVDDGVLCTNPARLRRANPPTPREVRAAKPEIHPWTAVEVANFASWAERQGSDPLRYAWLLAISTGLRRGEVLALRWRDVDLQPRRLSVRRSRVTVWEKGASRRTIESVPKGAGSRAGTRHVELGEDAVGALRAQRSFLASIEPALTGRNAHVFVGPDGHPFDGDRVSQRFGAAVRRYNVGAPETMRVHPIRFHDLRHTHATVLLQAGVHPKAVQERLGHSSIAITMDLYSHVLPTTQRAAADAFARTVRSDRVPTKGVVEVLPPEEPRGTFESG